MPHAFSGSGLAFGLAYLVVVSVHTSLFMRSSVASVVAGDRAARAVRTSARRCSSSPAARSAERRSTHSGRRRSLFDWLTPGDRRNRGFDIGAAHFVERHGLVVIVAIGESVVAIGIGSSHLPVDAGLVVAAVLGLALARASGGRTSAATRRRQSERSPTMPPVQRATAALRGFGYWHIPMLLGIVAIAAAERRGFSASVRRHSTGGSPACSAAASPSSSPATCSSAASSRSAAAAAKRSQRSRALATMPLGALVSPVAQTAALVLAASRELPLE